VLIVGVAASDCRAGHLRQHLLGRLVIRYDNFVIMHDAGAAPAELERAFIAVP
jgi:hypothetical protein